MKDPSYIIIAGTTKAGSTSLFQYLGDHPQICPSKIKETRFFLDEDYPQARIRNISGIYQYENYFENCSNTQIRLDGSPQYLYSPGTPRRIRESLDRVKLIFILRNPVDRLISVYRFSKQLGYLPKDAMLSDFVLPQLEAPETRSEGSDFEMALEHGNYSQYLNFYFDHFEKKSICIVFLEDLKRNHSDLLRIISNFSNIDSDFYNDYEFRVFNKTRQVRIARIQQYYTSMRRTLNKKLIQKERIWSVLDSLHRNIRPFYVSLNSRASQRISISDDIRLLLEEYYREEEKSLSRLLERKISWFKKTSKGN